MTADAKRAVTIEMRRLHQEDLREQEEYYQHLRDAQQLPQADMQSIIEWSRIA